MFRKALLEELPALIAAGTRRLHTSKQNLLEIQEIPGITILERKSGLAPPRDGPPPTRPEDIRNIKRITTALSDPLPGITPNAPYKASSEPPPTEITTLSNGVRIISESSPVSTHLFMFQQHYTQPM